MLTLLRFVVLLAFSSLGGLSLAQGVDDLFEDSETKPPCECHHHTFSLDNPPAWVPKPALTVLKTAVRSNEANWQGAVLFCPRTNAVIEYFPFKHAYRFLVCPSDWKGFKPKRVTGETLIKNGIPIEKIRAMFQSVMMGPIEVSFRARHSDGMMGRMEINSD